MISQESNYIMFQNKKLRDRHGKIWIASKLRWEETDEKDFLFWYEKLTPEERVEAVGEALLNCLKTKGIYDLPRLRRVHRRIKQTRS